MRSVRRKRLRGAENLSRMAYLKQCVTCGYQSGNSTGIMCASSFWSRAAYLWISKGSMMTVRGAAAQSCGNEIPFLIFPWETVSQSFLTKWLWPHIAFILFCEENNCTPRFAFSRRFIPLHFVSFPTNKSWCNVHIHTCIYIIIS